MSSAVFAILIRACMAIKEGEWGLGWGVGVYICFCLFCVEKAEGTLFICFKDRNSKNFLIGIHSVKVILVQNNLNHTQIILIMKQLLGAHSKFLEFAIFTELLPVNFMQFDDVQTCINSVVLLHCQNVFILCVFVHVCLHIHLDSYIYIMSIL